MKEPNSSNVCCAIFTGYKAKPEFPENFKHLLSVTHGKLDIFYIFYPFAQV